MPRRGWPLVFGSTTSRSVQARLGEAEQKPLCERTLIVRSQGADGGGTRGDAATAQLRLGFGNDAFLAWHLLQRRPDLEWGVGSERDLRVP